MKKLFLFIISLVALHSCHPDIPEEKGKYFSYREQPAKTVYDFLQWYKKNYQRLNQISLVNSIDPNDSLSYYTINATNITAYLDGLKSSGYVSESYLNGLKDHFTMAADEMKQNKQNDGPPSGFEFDQVMLDQEFEADLDSVANKTVILNVNIVNADLAYVLISFQMSYKRLYTLGKKGNTWLIDKIEPKS